MKRRKTVYSAGRSSAVIDEDVNPLETVANLSDVMLVLAVALMLALVSLMGVDLSAATDLSNEDLQPVTADLSEGQNQEQLSGDGYEEVGAVYRDLETGELYLLSEE
ncbi:MAG: DUF2149 domain-containing protein [Coriobacteriales bacterium]|jgi:hypothetical protein|nr:DUF2149 domain-containing protein [Coriobacteriales bacterium]